MSRYRPDFVLCIGQAGGRSSLTPEQWLLIKTIRIPDNDGNQPIDLPIRADGAPAYFSSLPIKAMVPSYKKRACRPLFPIQQGTFVCNHLMYQALYLVEKKFPHIKAGFMHIPYMMEQVVNRPTTPAMSLVDIRRGIEAAIGAIIEHGDEDLKLVGGETH